LNSKDADISRINLSELDLPLRSEQRWDKESDIAKNVLAPIREQLVNADAFVILSPERSGMVAPGLKNFFLLASSKHEFAHKPALLIWVSSGTWWSYPIAELRMSSYKNTKLCYIPDHVIVRDIENILENHEMKEKSTDYRIKSRIDRSLDHLIQYGTALQDMRKNTKIDLMQHEYGM